MSGPVGSVARGGQPSPGTRPAPPRRGAAGSHVRTLICWVGGATMLAVGLVVVARMTGRHPGPLVVVVSVLPSLLAVAVLVGLASALIGRHRLLGAAAAVLALVWGVLYVPELGGGARGAPPGWPSIRVVSANVLFSNTDLDPTIQLIDQLDPDVLVLQEATDGHLWAIDAAPIGARFPHRIDARQLGAGTVLLSQVPLTSSEVRDIAGRPTPIGTVDVDGHDVTIVGVHLTPPLVFQRAWRAQLHGLAHEVPSLHRPMLVGDFNASADHAPFRHLLDAGVEDAHRAAGSGWGATWPARDGLLSRPFVRIDHVLTGDGLLATSFAVHDGGGSDHQLLVADVAVDPDA